MSTYQGSGYNVYATSSLFAYFTSTYQGYGTTANPGSYGASTTYGMTTAVSAIASSCANFVAQYQNPGPAPYFQLFESTSLSKWVCAIYYSPGDSPTDDFAGVSSDVGCAYAYYEYFSEVP